VSGFFRLEFPVLFSLLKLRYIFRRDSISNVIRITHLYSFYLALHFSFCIYKYHIYINTPKVLAMRVLYKLFFIVSSLDLRFLKIDLSDQKELN